MLRLVRRRSAPPSPPPAASADEFPVEQYQKLVEIYGQRCGDADSQATTVITAAVTLAALIVTASATLRGTSTLVASIALIALVVSAVFAVLERSVAGLHPVDAVHAIGSPAEQADSRLWDLAKRLLPGPSDPDMIGRSLLSHESEGFREALYALRAAADAEELDPVRRQALLLWRWRARDLHYTAQVKERFAAAAGLALAVAVLATAVMGFLLVLNPSAPAGAQPQFVDRAAAVALTAETRQRDLTNRAEPRRLASHVPRSALGKRLRAEPLEEALIQPGASSCRSSAVLRAGTCERAPGSRQRLLRSWA